MHKARSHINWTRKFSFWWVLFCTLYPFTNHCMYHEWLVGRLKRVHGHRGLDILGGHMKMSSCMLDACKDSVTWDRRGWNYHVRTSFQKVITPVFATTCCRVGLRSWTLWLTGCGLVACKILVKIPSPEPAKGEIRRHFQKKNNH